MSVDIVQRLCGDKVAAVEFFVDPGADFGARDFENLLPDERRREAKNLFGLFPLVEAGDCVVGQNKTQSALSLELTEGVDRIGGAFSFELDGGDAKMGNSFEGKLQHGETVSATCDRGGAGFERRTGSGTKEDFIEMVGLTHFDGEVDVSKVNGIKGAAEKSDGLFFLHVEKSISVYFGKGQRR